LRAAVASRVILDVSIDPVRNRGWQEIAASEPPATDGRARSHEELDDMSNPDHSGRPDEEIREALESRLIADTRIGVIEDTRRIGIAVRDGVVTLIGTVGSEMAKRAAGEDAWETPGVVNVLNNLDIR
jgi:osmotically-inducible protein OsmY